MAETKLLPCPFCGGTHIEILHAPRNEYASVDCCESEMCSASTGWHDDMKDAIAAWNTRAADPLAQEIYEALLRICKNEEGAISCGDPSCDDCEAYRQAKAALAKAVPHV